MSLSVKKLFGVLTLILVAAAAFILGTTVVSLNAQSPVNWTNFPITTQVVPQNASSEEQILAGIYNRVSPSVVSINVISRGTSPLGDSGFAEGSGTGFVIDTEGHIVTNSHVIEGAVRIEVNFFDGRIVRGEIVGDDPDSDLAVIRVDVPADTLTPVQLGDSNSLFIGQEVIAIGSPFNQRWTMTTGIISALDRTIQGLTNYSIGSVIQTDAAINPGNSGGPLLNRNGEVIGVNSQIISQTRSNSGVGFAIPVNLVRRVAASLISDGEVEYSYLGIRGGGMTLDIIEALNLPNNAYGVVVSSVESGTPAARAGLQSIDQRIGQNGSVTIRSVDIITEVNGTPLRDMSDLVAYLAEYTEPGQTINLTVVRGSEEFVVPVTLDARPS